MLGPEMPLPATYRRCPLTFGTRTADEVRVASLLALEYPNGRTADVVVDDDVEPGEELNLYGRRWRVVGKVVRAAAGGRYGTQVDRRLLCRTINE